MSVIGTSQQYENLLNLTIYIYIYTQVQGGARNVVPLYHPIKIVTSQYRCCKRASECCSSWKMRQMSPVCKMADDGEVDCRSKGESCIVLCRNKECSSDSETFSCTLWYKVGSLQTDNLQTFIRNNFPACEDLFSTGCQMLFNNKNVLCVQSLV